MRQSVNMNFFREFLSTTRQTVEQLNQAKRVVAMSNSDWP